jgi:hypothetical protein
MRLTIATMAAAILFGLAGAAGAAAPATPAPAAANATPVGSVIVAQRCRCVERRWNGSCKLRVCRDHW